MNFSILVIQPDNYGGEQIAVKRLFDAYKKENPKSFSKYKLLKPFRENRDRFSFLGNLIKYFIGSRATLLKIIKSHNYDFFITSDYLLALAFYSLRIRKIKIIFLFHGLRSVIFKNISDINYRQIVIKILEKLCIALSDAIVVPSSQAKRYLGFTNAFVVQNIVPNNFFLKKYKKNKNRQRFTVLYSGRIVRSKGLENLMVAFDKVSKKIPEAKLIIAYPTVGIDKQLYSDLIRAVKNINHGLKSVKFIPNSTQDELINLYNSSNVLVLASELEFAPLSVVEAMAAGTPVIGTNVGNIGNLLSRIDKNLILKNNSPEEIENKLMRYYQYADNKRNVLGDKCIEVAKNFISEKPVKNFTAVLENFS